MIVIRYNAPKLEEACLKSVVKHTQDFKLTVFDNYKVKENLAKVWNKLIKESTCEYICLLNSDTMVYKDWLEGILQGFRYNKDIRIVGPSTNNCKTEQINQETGLWKFVEELSGFCYTFPKSHWEEMGGFDEKIPFYGQESDFNMRTRMKGYKLCWVKPVFVYHYGSGSLKLAEERGETTFAKEKQKGNKYFWDLMRERGWEKKAPGSKYK